MTSRIPPPEWAAHAAIWTAWPADAELWEDDLEPARAEVAAMVDALTSDGDDGRPGDTVRVLVMGAEARASAQARIGDVATLIDAQYGDIWLRDTGPIFATKRTCAGFEFNGWGGKYKLRHDDQVARQIATSAGATLKPHSFVLEGGAIDGDGTGVFLTTRQCLLNPNRNPQWTSEADVEAALRDSLGASHIIWLDEGLINDHTDGHVDNIARFVAPGVVLCQSPTGPDDPNAAVLDEIHHALCAVELEGRGKLKVLTIPSPGRVTDSEGNIVPASHMNFVIGNRAVVLPVYGAPDAAPVLNAISVLQKIYPGRRIVPLSSSAILTGGGSFHCITQQQPEDA